MSPMLVGATVAISLALVLYTCGVFLERRRRNLDGLSLALFWLGFACDTSGTTLMTLIAHEGDAAAGAGAAHAVSGALAIALMAFHAIWATWTYLHGSERSRERFHRLSQVVWTFWLIPYVMGLLQGMPMLKLETSVAVDVSVAFALAVGAIEAVMNRCRDAREG